MTKKEDLQIIADTFKKDYCNTTFTSRLYELFDKRAALVEAYIKPGREFWYYDSKVGYRKLKVTYARTGVMFFEFEDEPNVEHAWFMGSFNCMMLYAAQIYPYEIGKLLTKCWDGADKDVPKICKDCNWDTCNGNITVEVVWDESKFDSAIQPGDDVRYNEDLGCRVNLSQLKRVAKKSGWVKELENMPKEEVREKMKKYGEEIDLKEGPVSEDLENGIKEALAYHSSHGDDFRSDSQIEGSFRYGFEYGAKWQKERDAKFREDNNICQMNFDDIEDARLAAYEQGRADALNNAVN